MSNYIHVLSVDQENVLGVLAGARRSMHVAEVAEAVFPRLPSSCDREFKSDDKHASHPHGISGYRRVLNALRKLVAVGYATRCGDGVCEATAAGVEWVELGESGDDGTTVSHSTPAELTVLLDGLVQANIAARERAA